MKHCTILRSNLLYKLVHRYTMKFLIGQFDEPTSLVVVVPYLRVYPPPSQELLQCQRPYDSFPVALHNTLSHVKSSVTTTWQDHDYIKSLVKNLDLHTLFSQQNSPLHHAGSKCRNILQSISIAKSIVTM